MKAEPFDFRAVLFLMSGILATSARILEADVRSRFLEDLEKFLQATDRPEVSLGPAAKEDLPRIQQMMAMVIFLQDTLGDPRSDPVQ